MTPGRRATRLAVAGALAALAVGALGLVGEWVTIGRTPEVAAERLERDSRRALARVTVALEAAADTSAASLAARGALTENDLEARDALFVTAASAPAGVAVTVYSAAGAPLAWAGRPSDHDVDRLAGATWQVTRGALGPRLLHIRTVQSPDGARVGTIVAEVSLAASALVTSAESPIVLDEGGRGVVRLTLAGESPNAHFTLRAPTGAALLDGYVAPDGVVAMRSRWHATTRLMAAAAGALGLLLAALVLLPARPRRWGGVYGRMTLLAMSLLAGARVLLLVARPAEWLDSPLFGDAVYRSPEWWPLLASPFDFLATGLTAALLAVAVLGAPGLARRATRHRRRTLGGVAPWTGFLATQLGAGVMVAALLFTTTWLVSDTAARAAADLLRFSLHPWDQARLALQFGLLGWHVAIGSLVLMTLQAALLPWRVGRHQYWARGVAAVAWMTPALAATAGTVGSGRAVAWLPALLGAAGVAWASARLAARARRGSQALRLGLLVAGLTVPGLLAYPVTAAITRNARAELIAARYGPEALTQRAALQGQLAATLEQLDAIDDLPQAFVAPPAARTADTAFDLWRRTRLAEAPVTSSIELHDRTGALFSRYAFNLPDDLVAPPTWTESSCDWAVFEEVSPFFADERRMLHAGRTVCDRDGTVAGSVVVHAVLDYENLPFIPTANPYLEVVRPADGLLGEGRPAEGLEYAVYGWSRTPLYASAERAWPLDDTVFASVEEARTPIWATLERDGRSFDVYLLSDRFGIYALGVPVATSLDHLVNLAELIVLGALAAAFLVAATSAARRVTGAGLAGRALVREIRASFYRKLFLAFVAVSVVPVVGLALVTRVYVAGQLRAGVEADALRTAAAARRVVEDLAAPRAAQQGVEVDDNLLVWVSRLIGQDVNIFSGASLVATSERNLFAAGLLPARTPAPLYRALALERQGGAVSADEIGGEAYLVAAAPLPALPLEAMLTVPLTTQQRAIEGQIDTLDRRVLLAVLVLVFGGAGIGYTMAERIADPVNRLTRATRALARGDLTARIVPTSSDELRRLMQDFNRMAAELQRQRGELEQRHRLAAWAEMASQVAHEIKNPLTPIQLHAEHLRRVHEDRGRPLGDVVADSTSTILDQVTLLRRIASDFSSFAASPVARLSRVPVDALVEEVLAPYGQGLARRVRFVRDVPAGTPDVVVDRTLLGRALTNLVENALHAMPSDGTLTVQVREEPGRVAIAVADTGVGMDGEALARAFEPSFSTKLTGTGLGLPIARRNVELSHGTIAIESEPGRGTTVTVRLPQAS